MIAFVFAGLVLSSVPDELPVHSIVQSDVAYDVYLHHGEEYRVQVCARYQPTGTRIERNTCGASAPFGIHTIGVQSRATPWLFDVNATYTDRASRIERRANELVNTQISPERFWYLVSRELVSQ